jgi:hypothetical protein
MSVRARQRDHQTNECMLYTRGQGSGVGSLCWPCAGLEAPPPRSRRRAALGSTGACTTAHRNPYASATAARCKKQNPHAPAATSTTASKQSSNASSSHSPQRRPGGGATARAPINTAAVPSARQRPAGAVAHSRLPACLPACAPLSLRNQRPPPPPRSHTAAQPAQYSTEPSPSVMMSLKVVVCAVWCVSGACLMACVCVSRSVQGLEAREGGVQVSRELQGIWGTQTHTRARRQHTRPLRPSAHLRAGLPF